MKYCEKCGKELFDEAVICPGCGCQVQSSSVPAQNGVPMPNMSAGQVQTGEKDTIATCALAFAFLVPIVGLILGIVGACKYKDEDYKHKSIIAIAISIVVWVIFAIIFANL